MTRRQTVFVDFQRGNQALARRWLKSLKMKSRSSDNPMIPEIGFDDNNSNAIMGYIHWQGLHNVPPQPALSHDYLVEGVKRGDNSSTFIMALKRLEVGQIDGFLMLEECAEREYPPALLTLGMHLMKSGADDLVRGSSHIEKARRLAYIPAKLWWSWYFSGRQYSKYARCVEVANLCLAKAEETAVSWLNPMSRRLSYFQEI